MPNSSNISRSNSSNNSTLWIHRLSPQGLRPSRPRVHRRQRRRAGCGARIKRAAVRQQLTTMSAVIETAMPNCSAMAAHIDFRDATEAGGLHPQPGHTQQSCHQPPNRFLSLWRLWCRVFPRPDSLSPVSGPEIASGRPSEAPGTSDDGSMDRNAVPPAGLPAIGGASVSQPLTRRRLLTLPHVPGCCPFAATRECPPARVFLFSGQQTGRAHPAAGKGPAPKAPQPITRRNRTGPTGWPGG